jgi:hypothetical protein
MTEIQNPKHEYDLEERTFKFYVLVPGECFFNF